MQVTNMRKLLPIILIVIIGALILYNTQNSPEEKSDNQDTKVPDEEKEETKTETKYNLPSRYSKIPDDLKKVSHSEDMNPPKSESDEYFDPVPVPGLINTAGGEDSAYILPDGQTLYFFFTPDVRVPAEKQILDEVTGMYKSIKEGETWSEPVRILLQETGKLSLDGCQVILGDTMYFASVREGYEGIHWFKAELVNGEWVNWVNVDDEIMMEEYNVGEIHISQDGSELYFHSTREDGKGQYDIWLSEKENGKWSSPINLETLNSERSEGWPCLSIDSQELWFSRDYGIWRSKRVNGKWSEPERMFFPLAGEPTLDSEGNVYFTHHFYKDDVMLEADIYVAYKKTT
jgi:hypothetical protein